MCQSTNSCPFYAIVISEINDIGNLSQLRAVFEKHNINDYRIDISKEEFRDLFGLEKQTSDYIFCKLARYEEEKNSSQKLINSYSKSKS